MALVAKAQKTVTRLDDGYTVRLAPAAIVIPANSDGTDPVLTSAKTRVFLDKADVSIAITISGVTGTGCTATFSGNEVSITALSALQGNVTIDFTGNDGYVGSALLQFTVGKQGESGITVILDNETHAVPANHDGTLPLGALDSARTKIMVFKGTTELTAVGANATPGNGQFRYNVESVSGGTTNRIDNSNVQLVTMTADNAVISIKVYVEGMTNIIAKQMTLTKIRGVDPAIVDRVENWTFTGTEEFDGSKIRAKSIVAAAINTKDLVSEQIRTSQLPSRMSVNENNDNTLKVRHSNGVIGIELGLVGGQPKLVFYDENAVKLWEGGMAGIVYVDNIPESWTTYEMSLLSAHNPPDIDGNITPSDLHDLRMAANNGFLVDTVNGAVIRTGSARYVYSAGRNGSSESNKVYEGYHTDQYKATNNWITNGWYGYSGTSAMKDDSNPSVPKYTVNVVYINSGRIMADYPIDEIYFVG